MENPAGFKKMIPIWKDLWLRGLRGQLLDKNGQPYRQAHRTLCDDVGAKCCLGVLAEIFDHEVFEKGGAYYHNRESSDLNKLDMETNLGLNQAASQTLAEMNDGRLIGYNSGDFTIPPLTFEQIAAWIERSL